MALRKIAGVCDDGDCPTIYRDDAGNVFVQGYSSTDQPVPDGEGLIRIPAADWRKLLTQLGR